MARQIDMRTTTATIPSRDTNCGNGAAPVRRLAPRLSPTDALIRLETLLVKAVWPDLVDCETERASEVNFLRFTCGYECLEVLREAVLERGGTGALDAPPRARASKAKARPACDTARRPRYDTDGEDIDGEDGAVLTYRANL